MSDLVNDFVELSANALQKPFRDLRFSQPLPPEKSIHGLPGIGKKTNNRGDPHYHRPGSEGEGGVGEGQNRRMMLESDVTAPPPPWGPEGINDKDDFLSLAVFRDEDPDPPEYEEQMRKWTTNKVVWKAPEPDFRCVERRKREVESLPPRKPGEVDIKFEGEFGYELMVILPFAYFHFLNGTLRTTTSCGDPSVNLFYWFSDRHTHNSSCKRDDYKNLLRPYGWRRGLHKSPIPVAWFPPPLASHFREMGKVWREVPAGAKLVVVSNKLSNEWNMGPINFFDLKMLRHIFTRFLDEGYYLVYNRPGNAVPEDQWQSVRSEQLQIDDYKLVRKFYLNPNYKGRIILMQDLNVLNPTISFNEVQVRMFARSRCFMSVQGGNSIMASYFGGTNLIFARKGFELDFQAYHHKYQLLAGTKISVARNFSRLRKHINSLIGEGDCRAI